MQLLALTNHHKCFYSKYNDRIENIVFIKESYTNGSTSTDINLATTEISYYDTFKYTLYLNASTDQAAYGRISQNQKYYFQ